LIAYIALAIHLARCMGPGARNRTPLFGVPPR
jgi:hypothetical protein